MIIDQNQEQRNQALLSNSTYVSEKVIESQVIPFHLDLSKNRELSHEQTVVLEALEIEAARIAIRSLASLAEINESDHLGGGLDLISALLLSLAVTDYEAIEYTIEHAHTSIGYYAALAAFGYLDSERVVHAFRRSLDMAGHVAWVPGGTQLSGGRLGIMIPVAVGQALGKRSRYGEKGWVIAHCGDAGWISGQALNGFNAADLHRAPISFIMHRNGIQLSGSNKSIMDKDPRPIIEALGITLIEIDSLHDSTHLFQAYREAFALARSGRPNLIYPRGYGEHAGNVITLSDFAQRYGIVEETKQFAEANRVIMETKIWIPGALMSYRDCISMLECLFLVNDLPGGAGHHDGHMKNRGLDQVLTNSMLQSTVEHQEALRKLRQKKQRIVLTQARPKIGTANLCLTAASISTIQLPNPGNKVSARLGSEAAYALIAEQFSQQMFILSCDLDPSTKLAKAKRFLAPERCYELSIEEQIASLMANGLAMSHHQSQLIVFSTFAAFFEGIAREGFEVWRYQRNLNGRNEGLNVTFHMSHVGACTGRDHFSGWGLDWVNVALGYLPYLHRFYAPADARAAFIAVRDLAAYYGAHVIAIPRDNLPILSKQDSSEPLWDLQEKWEAITRFRSYPEAERAILSLGAPAFLAEAAAAALYKEGLPTDVYIINGFSLGDVDFRQLFKRYSKGMISIEDGIIASRATGLRGFAGFLASMNNEDAIPLAHLGITDPRIAPSEGHMEVWEHFGITEKGLIQAVKNMEYGFLL